MKPEIVFFTDGLDYTDKEFKLPNESKPRLMTAEDAKLKVKNPGIANVHVTFLDASPEGNDALQKICQDIAHADYTRVATNAIKSSFYKVGHDLTLRLTTKSSTSSRTSVQPNRVPAIDRSLYIGNLPANFSNDDMTELFSQFGGLVSVHVALDPITNVNLGYGYACFQQQSQRDAAISKYNRETVFGNVVRVMPKQKQDEGKIFICNLDYRIEELELRNLFSQFGEILTVDLLRNPNGTSKGCATIQFERSDSATTAINTMNETVVKGRMIKVEAYTPTSHLVQHSTKAQSTHKPDNKRGRQPERVSNTKKRGTQNDNNKVSGQSPEKPKEDIKTQEKIKGQKKDKKKNQASLKDTTQSTDKANADVKDHVAVPQSNGKQKVTENKQVPVNEANKTTKNKKEPIKQPEEQNKTTPEKSKKNRGQKSKKDNKKEDTSAGVKNSKEELESMILQQEIQLKSLHLEQLKKELTRMS